MLLLPLGFIQCALRLVLYILCQSGYVLELDTGNTEDLYFHSVQSGQVRGYTLNPSVFYFQNYRVSAPFSRHSAAPHWQQSDCRWRSWWDPELRLKHSLSRCIPLLHIHDCPDCHGNLHHHTGCQSSCHLHWHCYDHRIPVGSDMSSLR